MSEASSLGHMPKGDERWSFDDSVTQVFEDMLQRSIPAYESMRANTTKLSAAHVQPDTLVLDIGCSRGTAMNLLMKALGQRATTVNFVGAEISEPMLAAAKERFKGLPNVEIVPFDLRNGFPASAGTCSVILSVLTLQFLPLGRRQRIIADAYKALVPGGAFLLVEKVQGASAEIDSVFVDIYYEHKREMGYTQEEIDRKRLSLEYVMEPAQAEWNVDMLRKAGFTQIDGYWRWMNFAAWIALK